MNTPTFSVIVAAYMAADYLGNAIRSVLSQTFVDFELIIVNDASPDDTTKVVEEFSDTRLRYLVHTQNRGLPATRNTGIRASSGKYIAFLDHDDEYLPEKLAAHYDYLEKHPDVGVTYNSRFEVAQSTKIVRAMWIAPEKVTLCDLVLGYPFSPSDVVIRREWLLQIGLLDESNVFHGEDLNTNCRLALVGCRFARVNRILNYRRNHPSRIRKNLDASLHNVFRNLEAIFNDPQCPKEVVKLRNIAFAENYLVWSYWAFLQKQGGLGQDYFRRAIQLDPTIIMNKARKYLEFLVWHCVVEESDNFPEIISKVFHQLPQELKVFYEENLFQLTLARTYLLKGSQAIIWGREEEGRQYFYDAAKLHAEVDTMFASLITHQLLGYESEFGSESALSMLTNLRPYLNQITRRSGDKLESRFLINKAFGNYHAGQYRQVPLKIMKALLNDPRYLTNRGVVSIFFRSIARAAL